MAQWASGLVGYLESERYTKMGVEVTEGRVTILLRPWEAVCAVVKSVVFEVWSFTLVPVSHGIMID